MLKSLSKANAVAAIFGAICPALLLMLTFEGECISSFVVSLSFFPYPKAITVATAKSELISKTFFIISLSSLVKKHEDNPISSSFNTRFSAIKPAFIR